jgi:hypothetical protein
MFEHVEHFCTLLLFSNKNSLLKIRGFSRNFNSIDFLIISPYGDAILKKLKLSVIACTNYFQLVCLLKDL